MHPNDINFAQDCTTCEKSVVYEIVGRHVYDPRDGSDPPTEYYLAKCTICGSASLFCREDYGNGFQGDSFYRLYPAQHRQIRFALPPIVLASYGDAVKCENAKAWTPVAVMVGRTLEAVANHYQAGSTLEESLKKMLEDGVISKEIHDWSTHLRVIRNIGAHAKTAGVTAADATEALDFAQVILEILFDLRPRFERMKQRRAGSGS